MSEEKKIEDCLRGLPLSVQCMVKNNIVVIEGKLYYHVRSDNWELAEINRERMRQCLYFASYYNPNLQLRLGTKITEFTGESVVHWNVKEIGYAKNEGSLYVKVFNDKNIEHVYFSAHSRTEETMTIMYMLKERKSPVNMFRYFFGHLSYDEAKASFTKYNNLL